MLPCVVPEDIEWNEIIIEDLARADMYTALHTQCRVYFRERAQVCEIRRAAMGTILGDE